MALSAKDKIEIHELAARYALAMDQGNIEAWMDTWSDDGVWEGALGKYSGHSELAKVLPDLGSKINGKRHVITNCIVDEQDAGATLICYMIILEAVHAPRVIATAVYTDLLINQRGKWKFAQRTVQLDPGFAAHAK